MQTPLTLWLLLALAAEVGLALFQRAWLVRLGCALIAARCVSAYAFLACTQLYS